MAIDYAKLQTDIMAARAAATVADPIDDGGTCNLDDIFLILPHANEAKMRKIADATGSYLRKSKWLGTTGYFVSVPANGQANRRAVMVEAGYKKLRELGWNVHHYMQMD